ncbi:MAG TPA: DsbC family protein [Desulfuromonadales bacterium]|nr:DsbC family protein [Desulfuromonadales bacterium]
MRSFIVLLIVLMFSGTAAAFTAGGCGDGKCIDCHSLEKKEITELLPGLKGEVQTVEPSEVPGLWLVEIAKGGKLFPLYIDFSKEYVIEGRVIRLRDRKDVTRQRIQKSNPVDLSMIPLDDALLLGSKDAATKAIVFTDPQCPYCERMHEQMKEVVSRDPEIAFHIKLYPLQMHPEAYPISKSIVCSQSLQMLEDSFAGKDVPVLPCEAPAIDANIALAKKLGINSTPTLILPEGYIEPGYKTADQLLRLLGSDKASPAN